MAIAARLAALVLCLGACRLAGAEEPQGPYLPLAPGKRWVLRSAAVDKPVTFTVLGQEGDAYRVAWDNPWMQTELFLVPRDGKVYVGAIVMNGQRAPMPPDSLYWDLAAPEGATWKNAIGTLTVLSRTKTVSAGERTYRDCVQIRETSKGGQQLFWTFAPGVGFVQFGEGKHAFVLEEGAAPAAASAPAAEAVAPRAALGVGAVRLGLSATLAANQDYTPANAARRFRESLDAGVNFIVVSPKWNEVERTPGTYDFGDVDFWIEQAASAGVDVACNIRVVDTNNRAMPEDLRSAAFDAPRVRERLLALIDALAPRFRGRLRWVMIGNEIDAYFKGHRKELPAYATLYREGATRLKARVPGVPVSTTVTFDGLDVLGSSLEPMDFLTVTYYPLNPDFTMRPPGDVAGDFERIRRAAGGKKVLLQEVGYSTSPLTNSSEERQAAFYANVFDQLEAHPEAILGAHFQFMSDFSDAVVAEFAKYYGLPNADRFKAYLKTLGMFDDRNRPKKGWEVFRERGRRLASTRAVGG